MAARMRRPSLSGSASPGRISVEDRIGSERLGQQRLNDRMTGNPHAHRAAPGMLQAGRGTSRVPAPTERELSGRAEADDPELQLSRPREVADFGQIAASTRSR